MKKKTNEQRIEDALERDPNKSNYLIAKNLGVTVPEVRRARRARNGDTPAPTPATTEEPTMGIPIGRMRVQTRRPAESAAKFIKRLPLGRGFCPKELAKLWGMSEESIKRHARDLQCIKFVEISEDEWKPMIMNPETAQKYV